MIDIASDWHSKFPKSQRICVELINSLIVQGHFVECEMSLAILTHKFERHHSRFESLFSVATNMPALAVGTRGFRRLPLLRIDLEPTIAESTIVLLIGTLVHFGITVSMFADTLRSVTFWAWLHIRSWRKLEKRSEFVVARLAVIPSKHLSLNEIEKNIYSFLNQSARRDAICNSTKQQAFLLLYEEKDGNRKDYILSKSR